MKWYNQKPERWSAVKPGKALKEKAEQASKANYKFVTEMTVYPSDQTETEENSASVCLIQCQKCGWYMFGDGWGESQSVNYQQAEQIPRFCAHCGAEFADEEQAALLT